MAEVNIKELYKVTVTEYEQGWGQRDCPDETKFFTSKKEAEEYAKRQSTGSYELFWRAIVEKIN